MMMTQTLAEIGGDMVGSTGPEHWIGEEVMITLSEADPDVKHQKGFLEGFNESGVTVLLGAAVR
jgi:ribosome maturation factor RimP